MEKLDSHASRLSTKTLNIVMVAIYPFRRNSKDLVLQFRQFIQVKTAEIYMQHLQTGRVFLYEQHALHNTVQSHVSCASPE